MVLAKKEEGKVMRSQLWGVLHEGRGRTGHAFELLLIIFIGFSIALLPLEFVPALQEFHSTLALIEIVTTAFFTVEYALRIYAAPNRLRYVFSFYGIIDVVSIAPFYVGLIGTQYLRAFRLIRLLKIGEMQAAAAEEEEETMHQSVGLLPEENVEYIVTHHPLFLFVGSLPSILALSAAAALFLMVPPDPIPLSVAVSLLFFSGLFLWKVWLDFSYDVIYVTSRQLIFVNQHILGRSINQVNYHAITNVKPYYPSLLGYIFRYGSILIETTAAEPGHLELHVVRAHEKAARAIMRKSFPGEVERAARK